MLSWMMTTKWEAYSVSRPEGGLPHRSHGPAAIVQAARVSYGAGTKHVSDDRNLIRYLMRHKHTTPMEMVEFKFHVRVPMDT